MVRRPNVFHERDGADTIVCSSYFQNESHNAILLEKRLRQKGVKALQAQGRQNPAIHPSDTDQYDRLLREGEV
jgi:hypothetical protein